MRIVPAVLLVLVYSAAAQTRPAPKSPTTHVRDGQTPPSKSDAQLEKEIRARFARSKIARNDFQVRVQGGVATLEGRTDVLQHKGTATRLAKNAGAKQVVNRIEIDQAARDRAAANLTTGRRRAQVKRGETRGER